MTVERRHEILELLGDSPAAISRDLRAFSNSARAFSSNHPRLIHKHAKQWVGVLGGEVKASGKTLKSVMSQLRDMDIRPEDAIIRFIDRTERTLIL